MLVIYKKISDKAVTLNSLCVQVGILNHFSSEVILTSLVSANNENTHKKDDIVYADHYLDLMLYFLPHITDTFIDVHHVRLAIFNLTELWSVFPTLCQKVDQALQILDFVDKNNTGHFNDVKAKHLNSQVRSGEIGPVVRFGVWMPNNEANYKYVVDKISPWKPGQAQDGSGFKGLSAGATKDRKDREISSNRPFNLEDSPGGAKQIPR